LFDDRSFKITLIKALEHNANNIITYDTEKMWEIITTLPRCNLYIEDTSIFSRREWNTFCSILHIQVPVDKQALFKGEAQNILDVAESIYGRKGDNFLTHIDIGILIEHYDVIDFSEISLTEVITKAIADAELLMSHGKFDSAFDRVHTAFHGYLRKILDNKRIAYEESETLNQLYNKLHTNISSNISSTPIAELVRSCLRSSSGAIASINDMRNRHSLSHPNETLLQNREAEFAIKLVKCLSEYINNVI